MVRCSTAESNHICLLRILQTKQGELRVFQVRKTKQCVCPVPQENQLRAQGMALKEWAKEINSSDRWRQEKEAISQRKQAHKVGVNMTDPPVHGPAEYIWWWRQMSSTLSAVAPFQM